MLVLSLIMLTSRDTCPTTKYVGLGKMILEGTSETVWRTEAVDELDEVGCLFSEDIFMELCSNVRS
jgi:hypothetical protein